MWYCKDKWRPTNDGKCTDTKISNCDITWKGSVENANQCMDLFVHSVDVMWPASGKYSNMFMDVSWSANSIIVENNMEGHYVHITVENNDQVNRDAVRVRVPL